jgi:hypothetical protein
VRRRLRSTALLLCVAATPLLLVSAPARADASPSSNPSPGPIVLPILGKLPHPDEPPYCC